MVLKYSLNSDRSNPVELTEGLNLPAQNIYIFADAATAPVAFNLKKSGASIIMRTENGAPYDLNGGTTTNATAWNATSGSYNLTVNDKVSNKIVNFTIGATVQIPGCTDPNATNYNPNATIDDGSCVYPTKPQVTIEYDPALVDLIVNGVKI